MQLAALPARPGSAALRERSECGRADASWPSPLPAPVTSAVPPAGWRCARLLTTPARRGDAARRGRSPAGGAERPVEPCGDGGEAQGRLGRSRTGDCASSRPQAVRRRPAGAGARGEVRLASAAWATRAELAPRLRLETREAERLSGGGRQGAAGDLRSFGGSARRSGDTWSGRRRGRGGVQSRGGGGPPCRAGWGAAALRARSGGAGGCCAADDRGGRKPGRRSERTSRSPVRWTD